MLTIVDFIEQYTPTLPCLEWEKSEVVRRRQVKEQQEERDWIANQEERTRLHAEQLAGRKKKDIVHYQNEEKKMKEKINTEIQNRPTSAPRKGSVGIDIDGDGIIDSIIPLQYVPSTDGLQTTGLKPALQATLVVVENDHKNSNSNSSSSSSSSAAEWIVRSEPTLEKIEKFFIESLNDIGSLSVGFMSPRVGPRYTQDVDTGWNEEERKESLITSMSLQGVPDPNVIAAREEKRKVLGAQKLALEQMESGAAAARGEVHVLSVNDQLAAEDDDTVTGIEDELEDTKYYIMQEKLLQKKGLGSVEMNVARAPSNRPQSRSKTPANYFEDTLRNGRTAPPVQVGGMNVMDDPTLIESRQRVIAVFDQTKPWMNRLISSFEPYVNALFDRQEEQNLKEYLNHFLHDSSASAAAATVPGELGGKTGEGALFSHQRDGEVDVDSTHSQNQKEEKDTTKTKEYDLSLEGITVKIEHYLELADAVTSHCSSIEYLPKGIVVIQCEALKKKLENRALELAGILLQGCQTRLLNVCTDLDSEYKIIEKRIVQIPTCSQDVFDARKYAKEVEEIHLPRLGVAFHHPKRGVKKFLLLLQGKFGQRVRFHEKETELIARVYKWPTHLENTVMVLAAGQVDMYCQKQANILSLERIDLEKDLRTVSAGVRSMRKRECRLLDDSMLTKKGFGLYEKEEEDEEDDEGKNENENDQDSDPDPKILFGWASHVAAGSKGGNPNSVQGAVLRSASLRTDLNNLSKISKIIESEEIRLGQASSDYEHQVKALGKALSIYENAWGDLRTYLIARSRIYKSRITTLDGVWEKHEMKTLKMNFNQFLLNDKLRDAIPLKNVLKEALVEINVFIDDGHLELLEMLATDGLEQQHWWDTMGRLITDEAGHLNIEPCLSNEGHPQEKEMQAKEQEEQKNKNKEEKALPRIEKCLGLLFTNHRLTLASCIDTNVHSYMSFIQPLCHRAKEQRKLELELDAMLGLWNEIALAWLELKRTAPKVPQKAWVSAKAKKKQEEKEQELLQEKLRKEGKDSEGKDNAGNKKKDKDYMATYRGTYTHVVEVTWRSITSIETLIEEQLTRVKMLQASPFVGPHLKRCFAWETRLDTAELVMNEWWEVQNSFSKLRKVMSLAVFANGSGAIEENIGNEYRKLERNFTTMQMECETEGRIPEQDNELGTYINSNSEEEEMELKQDLTKRIQAPSLRLLGGIVTLKKLKIFVQGLDKVKAKLRKAVDKRCETFPRLWLQSEDQIYQLLVDARDQIQVQNHISIIFPGVNGVMFGSGENGKQGMSVPGYIDSGDITAVYCDDGEMIGVAKRPSEQLIGMKSHLVKVLDSEVVQNELQFHKILKDPTYINPEGQRSPIELWMLQLETEIRRTVFTQIDGAVRAWPSYNIDVANRGRKIKFTPMEALDKWIKRWPIQALLTASSIHWCMGIEKILRKTLPTYEKKKKIHKNKNRNRNRSNSKEDMIEPKIIQQPLEETDIKVLLREMLVHLRDRMKLFISGIHSYQTVANNGNNQVTTSLSTSSTMSTSLTKLDKEKRWRILSKYTSLIIRTRHREHVMEEMLKEGGTTTLGSGSDLTFFWLAQMRSHFEPNMKKDKSIPGKTSIRVFGVSIQHGGEMFGCKTKSTIVITPLTERCYRAILLSLSSAGAHGGSGAVLNGPPGMGKTDTMRMCALECGVACPTLNGSDRVDGPTGMVRMIRASTGSGSCWLLLDNIGRVPMAVLSVVGHALATLRRSIITTSLTPGGVGGYQGGEVLIKDELGALYFQFNGRRSIVKAGGCVVATVDYDHEERSEKSRRQLPENLSLFFRPCTLLSFGPLDLERVAECTLLAGGFRCSERLARRVTTLHTCAGQLLGGAGAGEEHQQHYDYSLRSLIKSVKEATELLQSDTTLMRSRTRSESIAEEKKLIIEGGSKEEKYKDSVQELGEGGGDNGANGSDGGINGSDGGSSGSNDSNTSNTSNDLDLMFANERRIMAIAWRRIHDPQLTDEDDRRRARRLVNEILLHGAESTNVNQMLAKGRVTLSKPEMNCLKKACRDNFVVPEPSFLGTVVDLHNTLRSRTGTLVLGASNSGKSCAIKLLARATPELLQVAPKRMLSIHTPFVSNDAEELTHVVPFVLNPMALTVEALFGTGIQPTSINDPRGGLLRHTLLRCIESGERDPKEIQWIIFDGPIDASWIEGMTTMFDSSRSLCLPTGEIISVPLRTKLLFEACTVANATPGAISRLGVVSIGSDVLSWRSLLRMWVRFFETRHDSNDVAGANKNNVQNVPIALPGDTNEPKSEDALIQETKFDSVGSATTTGSNQMGGVGSLKGSRRQSIQYTAGSKLGLKAHSGTAKHNTSTNYAQNNPQPKMIKSKSQTRKELFGENKNVTIKGLEQITTHVTHNDATDPMDPTNQNDQTLIKPKKKASPLDRWKKAAKKFKGKTSKSRGSSAALGNSKFGQHSSQANRDHAADDDSSGAALPQHIQNQTGAVQAIDETTDASMQPGAHLTELFEAWLEPCIGLLHGPLLKHCFGSEMNALSFTRGTLHILDVLLDPSGTTESDSVDGIGNHHVKTTNGLHDNDDDAHRKHFDCMFLCALTNAIGAYLDGQGRKKFSELCTIAMEKGTWFNVHSQLDMYLKRVAKWDVNDVGGHKLGGNGWPIDILHSKSSSSSDPDSQTSIFDLFYNTTTRKWNKWLDPAATAMNETIVTSRPPSAQSYSRPPSGISRRSRPGTAKYTPYHWAKHSRKWGAIFVPTSETISTEFWSEHLLRRGCPVLFRGPTGAGKTALAHRVLLTLENEQGYSRSIEMHFAIDTGAHQLQKLVDRRMQRRKRGFYEPAHGKPGVLFVDDVHAPSAPVANDANIGRASTVEVVELMRQLVSNGGWYDLDTMDFRRMQKLTLFAATTDSSVVSPRFTHHLVPLALVGLDDPDVLISVFHKLLGKEH